MKPENLKRAVMALALPYEQQVSLFPEFVVVADELALNYDTEFDPLRSEIKEPQYHELDRLIAEMSGKQEYWTLEGLRDRPEWETIRKLAADILTLEGWPKEPPPLDHLTYVGPPES